jgi:hypothetical protein
MCRFPGFKKFFGKKNSKQNPAGPRRENCKNQNAKTDCGFELQLESKPQIS